MNLGKPPSEWCPKKRVRWRLSCSSGIRRASRCAEESFANGSGKRMSEKSAGIDFDRSAFVQPQAQASVYSPRIGVFFLFLGALLAIGYLAFKMVSRGGKET